MLSYWLLGQFVMQHYFSNSWPLLCLNTLRSSWDFALHSGRNHCRRVYETNEKRWYWFFFSLSDLVYNWFLFLKLELRGRDRDDLICIGCLCIYMHLVYIDFGLQGSMLGGSHDMISHYMQPLCSLGPINSFYQMRNLGIGGSLRWTKSFHLVSVWTRIWTQIWKNLHSSCLYGLRKKKIQQWLR